MRSTCLSLSAVVLVLGITACDHPVTQEEFDAFQADVKLAIQRDREYMDSLRVKVVDLRDNVLSGNPVDPTNPPAPPGGFP